MLLGLLLMLWALIQARERRPFFYVIAFINITLSVVIDGNGVSILLILFAIMLQGIVFETVTTYCCPGVFREYMYYVISLLLIISHIVNIK